MWRVIDDVAADFVQFMFIADDMFIIVTLPDGPAGSVLGFIDSFCNGGFKRTDNRWN